MHAPIRSRLPNILLPLKLQTQKSTRFANNPATANSGAINAQNCAVAIDGYPVCSKNINSYETHPASAVVMVVLSPPPPTPKGKQVKPAPVSISLGQQAWNSVSLLLLLLQSANWGCSGVHLVVTIHVGPFPA